MNNGWMEQLNAFLAQAQPQAGATPASSGQPVNAVGVPGSSSGVTGASGSSQGLPANSTGPGGPNLLMWIFPLIAVMAIMTLMTGRKDKKKRAELMASLKKHDRVQMIGGEIGTITDLTDDEVVLRVEEGRIRFARSAVQTVLTASKAKGDSTTISEVKGEAKAASV
jgi:preprotein translocase YajC subunit